MKILFMFLLLPFIGFSQRNKEEKTGSYNNSYGYVNGLRLDSVNAVYGQIALTAGANFAAGATGTIILRRYTFDFGQPWKQEREIRITDKEGNALTFQSFAEFMNFMDFNGWGLVYFIPEVHQALLKKKL